MNSIVVIGGSAAGLSATLSAARSLLKVVCIDYHKPCNRYADHAHNFFTRDGEKPSEIISTAIEQIKKYPSVELVTGLVEAVTPTSGKLFNIVYNSNGKKTTIQARKVIFASGINDKIDEVAIDNFSQFWGKSVIHCPYCHGYENARTKTALLYPNIQIASKMAIKLMNWSSDLVVLTNGIFCENDDEIRHQLTSRNINIIDKPIASFEGDDGQLRNVTFKDNTTISINTIYTLPPYEVNNKHILEKLGLEFNEQNLVRANEFGKTTVPGIYVAGDICSMARSISLSSAAGFMACVFAGQELFEENWDTLSK